MAGGPLLRFWESVLGNPLVKDLRIRFAVVMAGNLFVVWFLYTYLKKFVPDLEVPFLG